MKLLHCADLHIDSPMLGLARYEGAPVERMRSATRRAVENLVGLAIDESVDAVLVGGDVFDGRWKDANTGLWWNRQMGSLVDAGIRVFVVHGNHDADSVITRRIRPPAGVHVFGAEQASTVVVDDLPLAVHGQSYATVATTTDLASGYPEAVPGMVNIGLLHTSLDGREGHADYAPSTPAALAAKGYDLWALGHVHRREHREIDGTHLLFPGNTQSRHAREPGPKSVSLIHTDAERVLSIEAVEVDVVRWERVEVDRSGLRDADEVATAVADQVIEAWRRSGRPLAARVELTGPGSHHHEHMRTQLLADLTHRSDGDIWLEKVIDVPTIDTGRAVSTEAVAAVLDAVEAVGADDDLANQLAEALGPLQTKVAGTLGRLVDHEVPSAFASPATVRRYLHGAGQQILAHLEGGE